MKKNKIICRQCKAGFYPTNQPVCGTCDKPFCPNCSACSCNVTLNNQFLRKKTLINLQDINRINEGQILEINATLSPLIGQTPTHTHQGVILKTEFELLDDNQKIPLVIWGPVPEKLFPFRYEYSNITISGLKKKIFNGKPILVASKLTKYFINNTRTKPLEYFISESSY